MRYMIAFKNIAAAAASLGAIDLSAAFQPFAFVIFGGTKILGWEFWVIQLIYAIPINVSIFVFIKHFSRTKYSCLLIYFLFFYPKLNFEIMRESLAIAFFIIGYIYLTKRKTFIYWLCAAGAFLAHISGLFMVFYFVIRKIPLTPQLLIPYIILSLCVGIFSDSIISGLAGIGNAGNYVGYQSSIFGKIGVIIKAIIFPGIVYYIAKRRNLNRDILQSLKLYPLVGCAELAIFILFRFENYMSPFMITAIGGIMGSLLIPLTYSKLVNNLGVLILCLFIYVSPYVTSITSKGYVPYYKFWIPYYSVLETDVYTGRTALMYSFEE